MSSCGGVGRTACGRAGWPFPHLRLAGAIFLLSSPAQAAHCPRGEIWLIHKHTCIGKARSVHVSFPPAPRPPVHLLHQPPEPPKPQSTRTPETPPPSVTPRPQPVDIPYVLPSSILGHVHVFDFEALPKPATATNPNRSE
jgi:hypothetical protein